MVLLQATMRTRSSSPSCDWLSGRLSRANERKCIRFRRPSPPRTLRREGGPTSAHTEYARRTESYAVRLANTPSRCASRPSQGPMNIGPRRNPRLCWVTHAACRTCDGTHGGTNDRTRVGGGSAVGGTRRKIETRVSWVGEAPHRVSLWRLRRVLGTGMAGAGAEGRVRGRAANRKYGRRQRHLAAKKLALAIDVSEPRRPFPEIRWAADRPRRRVVPA
ncbi:hypothetical protein V8D89_003266 [Ganoderma adspersum]